MFRYNQNSWTNLLIKSPARSATPGRSGNKYTEGRSGIQSGRTKTLLRKAEERTAEAPRGGGVGSALRRADRLQLLQLALFLMRVDFEKPKLCLRAGNPAWPSEVSVKFLTFAPKRGAQESAEPRRLCARVAG